VLTLRMKSKEILGDQKRQFRLPKPLWHWTVVLLGSREILMKIMIRKKKAGPQA